MNGPTCFNCGTYYVSQFINAKHYCEKCAASVKPQKSCAGCGSVDLVRYSIGDDSNTYCLMCFSSEALRQARAAAINPEPLVVGITSPNDKELNLDEILAAYTFEPEWKRGRSQFHIAKVLEYLGEQALWVVPRLIERLRELEASQNPCCSGVEGELCARCSLHRTNRKPIIYGICDDLVDYADPCDVCHPGKDACPVQD